MKNEKKKKLIQILRKASSPISSASLAKMLGVSERTIRNYINQINQEGGKRITASKSGYEMKQDNQEESASTSKLEKRVYCLLSRLLAFGEPVSVFDIAEELMVSESTILNNVIPEAKKIISPFHLRIESKNYNFVLNGNERNKRKLIGYIVSGNTYGYFTSMETLEQLFPEFDIKKIWKRLYDICLESALFLNNYAFNNFLVHIMILMIRLESKDPLKSYSSFGNADTLLSQFEEKDAIILLAENINRLFSELFGQSIPKEDYEQILVFIALSLDHGFHHILNELIDEDFLQNIIEMMDTMAHRYNIPPFDRDFILQFSLHMYQTYQRCQFHMSYPNPIMEQIKMEHALIYDMAVWLAHEFSSLYSVELNEDEIGFIAFHIGGCLENSKNMESSITCIILVENYHDFTKKTIEDIKTIFSHDIVILDIMSIDQYAFLQSKCDLLISTLQLPISHPHKVTINPILTKRNTLSIWDEIENIKKQRDLNKTKNFLESLLKENLYFRNIFLDTPEAYIRFMGRHCEKLNYIQEDFITDVLLRENVSSTAFTDYLAVPHSISKYAMKSFICIIHNDSPIPWGKKHVQFILMIGISQEDMKAFNNAFELIVERFYSTDKVLEILNTDTFEEFKEILLK